MHAPARSKCECDILSESIEQLVVDTKQCDEERLVDCSKRFEQARKTFTAAVGTNAPDEFVKQTKCHTAASGVDEQEEVRNKALERWMAQTGAFLQAQTGLNLQYSGASDQKH